MDVSLEAHKVALVTIVFFLESPVWGSKFVFASRDALRMKFPPAPSRFERTAVLG